MVSLTLGLTLSLDGTNISIGRTPVVKGWTNRGSEQSEVLEFGRNSALKL